MDVVRLARGMRLVCGALPYPLLLTAGTLLLRAQPTARQDDWLDYVSTSLANLAGHPVRAMVGSALVTEGNLAGWTVLAAAGLAALATRLGAVRALALASGVHILATGVSEGLVAVRIARGALPASARYLRDVGPSYMVVAALVAAVAVGTAAGRLVGGVGFAVLAPSLFSGLAGLDVAAVGHVASIALALLLAPWLARHGSRSTGGGQPRTRTAGRRHQAASRRAGLDGSRFSSGPLWPWINPSERPRPAQALPSRVRRWRRG